jgi:hypothetical protein
MGRALTLGFGLFLASGCGGDLNVGSAEVQAVDGGSSDASVERIDQIAMELQGEWISVGALLFGSTLHLSLTATAPRSGTSVLRCTTVQGNPCNDNPAPPPGIARDAGGLGEAPFLDFLDMVFTRPQLEGTYWVHTMTGTEAYGVFLFSWFGLEYGYDTTMRDVLRWGPMTFTRVTPDAGSAKP